jgi:hypothetical protein
MLQTAYQYAEMIIARLSRIVELLEQLAAELRERDHAEH